MRKLRYLLVKKPYNITSSHLFFSNYQYSSYTVSCLFDTIQTSNNIFNDFCFKTTAVSIWCGAPGDNSLNESKCIIVVCVKEKLFLSLISLYLVITWDSKLLSWNVESTFFVDTAEIRSIMLVNGYKNPLRVDSYPGKKD